MPSIDALPTPALLLDLEVLEQNLARMAGRAEALGVALRPHVKTHKCVEIGERQRALGATGITVSTLYEAAVFADHGFDDITWAYPVILSRIPEAAALAERCTLRLVVDSDDGLDALELTGHAFHVWLKVDCGYHRAGVDPAAEHAVRLAKRLGDSRTLRFDGVLTHSGHAYQARSPDDLARVAGQERDVMVAFAERLSAQGIAVPAVSLGSTPAMSAVDHLAGVTEIRPGNYVFYDYTGVALGACEVRDCAVTVLASVVSAPPGGRHAVVDAGALALSKDWGRGAPGETGMGRIFADYAAGTLRRDAMLTSLSQEHGIVNARLPVGARLRILPNHSCLTVACWDEYIVVRGEEVVGQWGIWRGR